MKFDFAKNQNVATLDTVPENARAFYEPNEEGEEGGFNLRTDPITKAAVASISGLSKSLSASRAEAKGLKGKSADLSSLSEYGGTVEEIVAGIAAKEEEFQAQLAAASEGKTTGITQADVDKIKEKIKDEMTRSHEAASQTSKEENLRLKTQLENYLIDTAFVQAAGNTETGKLARKLLGDQVRVMSDEDGNARSVVVDASGEVRYNGSGDPMGVSDLVEEGKALPGISRIFDSERPAGGEVKPSLVNRQTVQKQQTGGDKPSHSKISDGLAKKFPGATR